jgi:amino-acid N-acetyltransferase
MTHDVLIRPGSAADFDIALALLARANLPVADLRAVWLDRFLVATVEQSIAGLIGLECYDSIGLLRSLVVDPEFRGAGLGRVLVKNLESYAIGQGVREMWLLTIDADAWFQGLGYEARPRDQAPAAIAQTAEFVSLCPGDAVLMQKTL